jgi:hypothetical protein
MNDFIKMRNEGVALEYFSRFHLIWKPLLDSDNIEKLLKANYQIRVKQ